jgi:predicted membrane protein
MKALLLICSGLLLISLADLPIGYYTLLRIVVSIGAIAVIIKEYEQGINFWIIIFGLILILFNPLIPVYLNDKEVWMPIDIIAAILFVIKSFTINYTKS